MFCVSEFVVLTAFTRSHRRLYLLLSLALFLAVCVSVFPAVGSGAILMGVHARMKFLT